MAFWDAFIPTSTESSSTTTVTDKPTTNYGLIAGGIILGIGAIVLIVWAFGGFKKKSEQK